MTKSSTDMRSLVCVVDDDQSVREALPELLAALGFAACAFESAEMFLSSAQLELAECLLIDVAMPGMTGPEMQVVLNRRSRRIPIIFITAHGDESLRPRLIAQGAVDCLFKPFSDTALLAAVTKALDSA